MIDDFEQRVRAVERGLGHRFGDFQLLVDAVTHSSFANERPQLARTDNDRLEFLGDAVLQWAISTLLWEVFPDAQAGEMTRRRAELVCEEGLASVARSIDLGQALRLGKGEARTGGRDKPRLLASAFEACIAAIYLDAGSDASLQVCRRIFFQRAQRSTAGERDFKTRLQEALQREGRLPPRYDVLAQTGPDHAMSFEVALFIEDQQVARGTGGAKLEAEQVAARLALELLEAELEAERG